MARLQGWWIAPVLASLSDMPLFFGATVLTAFNDNALITYLSTLVPNLTDAMKAAVVEGAVTGGGLTVIANAPNPAGQAILGKFFGNAIEPLWLAVAALLPTLITIARLSLRLTTRSRIDTEHRHGSTPNTPSRMTRMYTDLLLILSGYPRSSVTDPHG